MTFKRMMVLGAMASALVLTGCQRRDRSGEDEGTGGAGNQNTGNQTGTMGSGSDAGAGGTDAGRR